MPVAGRGVGAARVMAAVARSLVIYHPHAACSRPRAPEIDEETNYQRVMYSALAASAPPPSVSVNTAALFTALSLQQQHYTCNTNKTLQLILGVLLPEPQFPTGLCPS